MKILTMSIAGILVLTIINGCQSGTDTERTQTAQQVSVACLAYAGAHNQEMPETLDLLKPQYLPASIDISRYRVLTDSLYICSRPDNVIFLCEKQPDPNGRRAVAFLSGRVELIRDYESVLNAKLLAAAFQRYIADHAQTLPLSIYELKQYLDDRFPLSHYELLTSGHMLQINAPAETFLFREKELERDGKRCIGYVDGHVELVKEQ